MSPDTGPAGPGRREATGADVAAVAAGMLLLAAVFTWPLITRMGSVLPGGLSDPLLTTWILAWDADRILHGLRGLWDAPFYFPLRDTLAFSEHVLGIAVFTAPIQWMTGNPVAAYNAAFLGSSVLAGVGTYLLALSLWGRRDAAWVAAIAFAFAPHRAMHVTHLQVLMSGWMPLALWALHRYVRTRSRMTLAVFAGAFLALAMSNGYFLYFFTVPVAVIAVAEVWAAAAAAKSGAPSRLRTSGRLLLDLGVAALAIGAALAPVAAAYVRARQSTGQARALDEIVSFSAQFGDYLLRPGHLPVWNTVLDDGPWERTLFPGLVVVVLAALGLVSAWHRAWPKARGPAPRRWTWHVGLYGAILALAVWLSMGPAEPGPYRLLLAALPGMDGLRVPARFVVLVALALAVLAGAGAAWLASRLRPQSAAPVAAALALVVAAEGYPGPAHLTIFNAEQRSRGALNDWLRAGPAGGVLELPIASIAPFTLPYQYNTLLHRRPIVNGYSGYPYALQEFLGGPASPLRELAQIPHVITGLRQIGVRALVLHPSAYEDWMSYDPSPIIRTLDDERGQIMEAASFPLARAWRLAAIAPSPLFKDRAWTRLALQQFEIVASASPADTAKIADADPHTRWETGAPQRGDEWLRIGLDRERDLVAIRLQYPPRWAGEYPRRLVIEGEADDGSRVELYNGSVLPHLINGMSRGGTLPDIVVTLRPNRTRRLWLRQTGESRHAAWAVPELALWERLSVAQ